MSTHERISIVIQIICGAIIYGAAVYAFGLSVTIPLFIVHILGAWQALSTARIEL